MLLVYSVSVVQLNIFRVFHPNKTARFNKCIQVRSNLLMQLVHSINPSYRISHYSSTYSQSDTSLVRTQVPVHTTLFDTFSCSLRLIVLLYVAAEWVVNLFHFHDTFCKNLCLKYAIPTDGRLSCFSQFLQTESESIVVQLKIKEPLSEL